jgi:protocatechuate 3,4-dioxygenase beta subunit
MRSTRRALLAPALALAVVAACGGSGATPSPSTTPETTTGARASASPGSSSSAAPAESPASGDATASCTAPATATIAQTEGPYYKAGAPETADLVTDGMAGTRLTLTGFVVSTDCTAIANAKVEIWQADSTGTYDNAGYTLRGYVMTDADGRFTILTVVPGEYPGRTEHIHVKLTPPGGSTLTTQLYFPGTTANDSDGIYDPSLLLDVAEEGDGLIGTYTFVLRA